MLYARWSASDPKPSATPAPTASGESAPLACASAPRLLLIFALALSAAFAVLALAIAAELNAKQAGADALAASLAVAESHADDLERMADAPLRLRDAARAFAAGRDEPAPLAERLSAALRQVRAEFDGRVQAGVAYYPRGADLADMSAFDREAYARLGRGGEPDLWTIQTGSEGRTLRYAAAIAAQARPGAELGGRAVAGVLRITLRTPAAAPLADARRERADPYAPRLTRLVAAAAASLVGSMLCAVLAFLLQRRESANRADQIAAQNDELRRAEAAMRAAALFDALTGLPNRAHVEAHLTERATRGGFLGVAHLNIDDFRYVNDTLGHRAGDIVLANIANRLRFAVADDVFAARIGGDAFMLVSAASDDADRFAHRLAMVREELREPLEVEARRLEVTISIGAATAEGPSLDAAGLMADADLALHRAKASGRGEMAVFSDRLRAEARAKRALAQEVFAALETNAFEPFYQMQVRASDFRVCGLEALARWRHPARGVLGPAAFLSVMTDLGVVHRLDRSIMRRALADQAAWRARGAPAPRIAVNVSARRLAESDLIDMIADHAPPRGSFAVELVESTFLDDATDDLFERIEALRRLGVPIEIDDFGTGHASIMSLTTVAPERLKIDRGLVTDIVENPAQRRLVEAAIEIGRALEIEIAAEGVETMEQALLLRELGCHVLQGFVFGRPVAEAEIQAAVEAQNVRADEMMTAEILRPTRPSRSAERTQPADAGDYAEARRAAALARDLLRAARQPL